jgi:glucose/arabinose dehydrogenase
MESIEPRTLLSAVPAGFTETQVAGNLTGPDALDIAADGRVFVGTQSGQIRVIQNGSMLPAPFADLSTKVESSGERGLLGVALDPNFAANRYVYVYYSAKLPTAHNRLSRLTADATNPNLAVPGSEVALLDFPDIGDAIWHMGGALQFGPDGKLYISIGDHQRSTQAQSLTSVFGKILRVNPDGTIPTDNPFYDQTTGINRSIWARGLRNPYTTAFQPGTGLFYLNDVGEATWEEIDQGIAGANYGWPNTEGDFNPASFPNFTRPLYAYQHTATRAAITGGAFYNPTTAQFPSKYVGKYFFVDFTSGELWYMDPASKAVSTFATGLIFANGIDVSPDGALYYLTRGAGADGQPSEGTGAVYKIEFVTDVPPTVAVQPLSKLVSIGQSATFSVSAAGSPVLSYQWTRNGADIVGATSASYTFSAAALTDDGAVFRARITNPFGEVLSGPATLSVTSNLPPVATIDTPTSPTSYKAGDTISFSGSGFDPEELALDVSKLTWWVDFHHNAHLHPFMPATSGIAGGSFTIPTTGETSPNVFYRIHLRVTDSVGLEHEVTRDVTPITANFQIKTSVPGLQILLDGQPQTAPQTIAGVAGMLRTVSLMTTQVLNGTTYVFTGWSDGGSVTHSLSFPDSDSTLTANFAALTTTYLSDLAYAETPTNGWGAPERDRSNGEAGAADGKTLTLNGQPYIKGIGAHANSDIRFNISGGGYTEFRSDIGVDDETGNNGSVIFQVYVDNVLKFTSGTMSGASPTQAIVIPLSNAASLRLVVSDAGNGNAYDHGDWANARLLTGSAPNIPSLLAPAVSYPTGTNAHGISSADLNGDGKLDLVVANAGASSVSVLFGLGNGTFTAASNYSVGSEPKSVALRDLNGDGAFDIVTANQGSSNVSVLLNNGNGSFASVVNYNGTTNAHEAALSDVDADGDYDIIVAGWGSSLIRVLFNQGNGTFNAGTTYTVGSAPHSVVAADFNMDGRSDIAVADHESNNVAMLYNNGNGTFKPAFFLNVGTQPHSIRNADLNGDSLMDLVTANEGSNTVSVLINLGDGQFAAAVSYVTGLVPKGVATGDFNDDGKLDIITTNTAGNYPSSNNPGGDQISVLLGNGNGSFNSPINFTTGRTPFSATTGDFDNDGDVDIATANWHTNNLSVLLNNTISSGTQPPPENLPPAAGNDAANVPHDTATLVNVLNNDIDIDGAIDPTSVTITTQPAHGTLIINNITGGVTYTPAADYSGSDEFYYTVADTLGAVSSPAKVSLTIAPATQHDATVYVSDLTPTFTQNGWGAYEKDRSNGEAGAGDGRAISLNGASYTKGIGAHAASDLRYNIAGMSFTQFLADIGVDDEVGNGGSVIFQVYIDNVLMYTSPRMTGASAAGLVNVLIPAGAAQLRLVISDAGDGNVFDHADWANARLIAGAPVPAPAAPTGLNAVLNGSKIDLIWTDASSNETGFRIERKIGNGAYAQIADLPAGSSGYSDIGIAVGNTYTYRVYAYNIAGGGNSGYSNEATIDIPIPPPPPGQYYLSDLAYTVVSNGWGTAEKDRSNGEQGAADGKTITLNGVTYTKGIGAHAASEITFNLGGQYTQFLSDVGVDDESGTRGSVIFQVWIDGTKRFDSGVMTGASATQQVNLTDLAGAQQLRLIITDAGDGNPYDHGDWAGARLIAGS